MSSTNKTTNYKLSQYVGTDKPTYLGDYNGDMLKIDTQMKANADAATNAEVSAGEAVTKATQAQTDIDNINRRVSSAETNITQLQTTVKSQGENITQISNTATNAQNSAKAANNKADSVEQELNNFGKWSGQLNLEGFDVATIRGTLKGNYNNDLKLLSIYGDWSYTAPQTGNHKLGALPSSIPAPKENRNIYAACTVVGNDTGLTQVNASIVIGTDRSITIDYGDGGIYKGYGGAINIMLCTENWND